MNFVGLNHLSNREPVPNRLITTRSREARKGRARRETRGSEQARKAGGEERLTWRVPQLFIGEDPISYCPRIDVGTYDRKLRDVHTTF